MLLSYSWSFHTEETNPEQFNEDAMNKEGKMGFFDRKYVDGMTRTRGKDNDGKYRRSYDCGDAVAVPLRGLVIEDMRIIADENGLGAKLKAMEDKKLNYGQIRMNIGRVLRQMTLQGIVVVIRGVKIDKTMVKGYVK